MLSSMQLAYQMFTQIKYDLRRHQKGGLRSQVSFLSYPYKIAYIRKEPQNNRTGMATCFLLTFHGPF